jgi:hypothetical protein
MALKPLPKKQWTFMVYMAGDNNLDPNGAKDLIEMKRIGSTDAINIIAQFDRSRGRGSKRYYLHKGGQARSDVVAEQGQVNAGDPKNLLDFVKWAAKYYPAERNMLVLWNHGQGWDDTDVYADERQRHLRRLSSGSIRRAFFHTPVRRLLKEAIRAPIARAILLDDGAKDFLDNQEMKKVLASARKQLKRKLDILGMDACLMSMAEVGYQIRDGADYSVGSQETEPLEGWPYNTILEELARNPGMTPRELAVLIPGKYVASFHDAQITQSAFDLANVEVIAEAVADLVNVLLPGLDDPAVLGQIINARARVQYFDEGDNIDLVDFCTLLKDSLPGSSIAAKCNAVIDRTKMRLVVASKARGDDLRNAHGVAVYFPLKGVSPLYRTLDFSRRTGWDRFLELYLTAVRRR